MPRGILILPSVIAFGFVIEPTGMIFDKYFIFQLFLEVNSLFFWSKFIGLSKVYFG